MYELIAPCHFGLESVLKREILDLGYEIVTVEDGRITFRGDVTAIARANIFIRTAERILLKMVASGLRILMNCLKGQRQFRGRSFFRGMQSSG